MRYSSALNGTLNFVEPHRTTSVYSKSVASDSLATWFPAVLKELLLSHLVALEVVADDQDHTSQLLSRGEVIGCISTAPRCSTILGLVSVD